MIMTPSQLAQLLCSVAVARNVLKMEVVDPPAGASDTWRHLSRQVPSYAARQCGVYAGHILHMNSMQCQRHLLGTLLIAFPYTEHDLHALNKTLSEWTVSRLLWAVVCPEYLLNMALNILPWQLDNQVQLLIHGINVSVWEAYRTAPHLPPNFLRLTTLSIPPYGPTEMEMNPFRTDVWNRRNNLTGLLLRCSVLEYAPFTILTDNPDGSIDVQGVNGDTWRYIQERLGFMSTCHRPLDGQFGGVNPSTGEWSGILGELQRGEVDFTPTPYVITQERAGIVNIPLGTHSVHYILIIQKPKRKDGSRSYTLEFSSEVWCAIFLLFLVSVVTMMLITAGSRRETPRGLSYSLITNWRIFCNMGYAEEQPQGTSYRSWLVIVLLLVEALHIYYSSFLIAFVASGKIEVPFEDLAGFFKSKSDYEFGLEKDSYIEIEFMNSKDPIMQAVWPEISSDNIMNTEAAVAKLKCDKNFVFMLDPVYYANNYRTCELLELPKKYFTFVSGIPLRQHGPVNKIIDRIILKIMEGGLHQRNLKAAKDSMHIGTCEFESASPIGLEETYTAFVMLGMSVGVSIAILGLEFVIPRFG